jgi:hypothetical protein
LIKPVAKDAVKEDAMFKWVKKIVDDFFDEIWPEIEDEVIYMLRFKYDQPPEFEAPKTWNMKFVHPKCKCCWYVLEVPR